MCGHIGRGVRKPAGGRGHEWGMQVMPDFLESQWARARVSRRAFLDVQQAQEAGQLCQAPTQQRLRRALRHMSSQSNPCPLKG